MLFAHHSFFYTRVNEDDLQRIYFIIFAVIINCILLPILYSKYKYSVTLVKYRSNSESVLISSEFSYVLQKMTDLLNRLNISYTKEEDRGLWPLLISGFKNPPVYFSMKPDAYIILKKYDIFWIIIIVGSFREGDAELINNIKVGVAGITFHNE